MKTPAGTQEIDQNLSLIHISEPTRLLSISYAVFCLKKYVYECCFVNNLHRNSNNIIRDILNEFFVSIFENEGEHLKKLLHHKETMVLLIVNRDNDKEEDHLQVQHIVAGVMLSLIHI